MNTDQICCYVIGLAMTTIVPHLDSHQNMVPMSTFHAELLNEACKSM